MRYSSHLYFRTDGSLGRYPIIEVDADGRIASVTECGATLREMGSQRFYSGVIVPRFIDADGLMSDEACRRAMANFASREEFCRRVATLTIDASRRCGRFPQIGAIAEGSNPGLLIIDGFDLNSFNGSSVRIRGIV